MPNRPRKDAQAAAEMIIDATIVGDREAANRHEVSSTTLARYRNKLKTDPVLAEAVEHKLAIQEEQWAQWIPETLDAGMAFLRRASEELDPRDPQAVFAITAAVKMVAEVEAMRRMLAARLGE